MKTFRAACCAIPLLPVLLAAQGGAQSLRAVRTGQPIRMDGRLDEAAWREAPAATGFTVQWPELGKPATLPTEVRILYDDRYLYVGARMRHDPKRERGRANIVQRLHRRDQDSSSDWFGVYLDSLHDRRTAWAFLVNAAGVQRDLVYYSDTRGDSSWDAVWESAVSVDEAGWTAELKIPLSVLRIQAGGGPQTWGVNFMRSDVGTFRETSYWEVAPRGVNAFVSLFPDLTGIESVRPQPRREWIPFVTAQRKFETSQTQDDRGWKRSAGFDAHLGLSSASQLDLAARPDFGQVEVDQAVLNLGTYETYFPEKRAFFLEGMDVFQVIGAQLFYSRRIGKGLCDPDLNDGETLLKRPQTTDMTAAAKYTAKYDNGLSVGVLGASVEPAKAKILCADGHIDDREISPLAHYGVFRAQQSMDDHGSYVGGFASLMHQAGPGWRDANVEAVDGVYKSADRASTFEGLLSRSEAGPRDGDGEGWRGRMRFNHQWKSGWAMDVQAANTSRTFDPNDVGYQNRADQQVVYSSVSRTWDRTWGAFRNWQWGLEGEVDRDQAGVVFNRYLGGWARTDFTNFWSVWLNSGVNLPARDDRELRAYDDPVKKYLRTETIPFLGVGFDTAGNRPWYLRFDLSRSWHEGGPSTDAGLSQNIKLNSAWEIQLATSTSRAEGERKYLETQGTTPIVGLRRLSEFDQTLRVSYAMNPRLSVQLFSQWLAANWVFRDLKSYVDDNTLAPGATSTDPATSDRVWNVNLITRWEFLPGSTAFLVYTHGASTDSLINDRGTLSPRADLGPLKHLPSDDVVQMKLSWLFR